MEQAIRNIAYSQSGLYEYLLAVYPDATVGDKVMLEKIGFQKQYCRQDNSNTRPHIAIASFHVYEAMEETILRYSQRICSRQQSFEVALNNYSGFPPHTIYLRVQNREPFRQIVKELRVIGEYISACSCPPLKLVTNPHLCISTRLSESTYLPAMLEYSQKIFYETFRVEELILMRRSNQYDNFKIVHVLGLQPRPAALADIYY